MKVLHIINSGEGGGAEKLLDQWVDNFDRYKIDVLCLSKLSKKLNDRENYFSTKFSSPYNPLNIIYMFRFISEYDVIHVHLFPAQLFVSLASIFFPSKVFITTEHSTHNRRRNYKIFRLIDCFIYSRYKKVVCISHATKINLLQWVKGASVQTINNGVTLLDIIKAPTYTKKDLNLPESSYVLCMASRFSEQKDQMTVIKSISRLPKNIYLLLLGEGERKASCEEYVIQNGLVDRVRFLGYREDVYSIFKSSDIVVQSSFWEGFGLTVVEAIACRKAVIVSDVEGMSDIVNIKEFIFSRGNVEDLISKILAIYENKFSVCEKISYLVDSLHSYSFSNMISKYERLYDDCLY